MRLASILLQQQQQQQQQPSLFALSLRSGPSGLARISNSLSLNQGENSLEIAAAPAEIECVRVFGERTVTDARLLAREPPATERV